jgi:hypothetical protein
VPEPLRDVWRQDGRKCPVGPAGAEPSNEVFDCTQALLVKLRELDVARLKPSALLSVDAAPEEGGSGPTGRWWSAAKLSRPNDPCMSTLGAGAPSPILVPARDAVTPTNRACAIETATALAERLLRGEGGTIETRGTGLLRVPEEPCSHETHGDVEARERAKIPQRVCAD